MLLFRAMKGTVEGLPEIGSSTRTLGVRPGIDVPVLHAKDMLRPAQGGMSVSPSDPFNLPYFRRPPEFGGTGRDSIWHINDYDLGPELNYRPDPSNPHTHGFVEPLHPMTLVDYQNALVSTQGLWQKSL